MIHLQTYCYLDINSQELLKYQTSDINWKLCLDIIYVPVMKLNPELLFIQCSPILYFNVNCTKCIWGEVLWVGNIKAQNVNNVDWLIKTLSVSYLTFNTGVWKFKTEVLMQCCWNTTILQKSKIKKVFSARNRRVELHLCGHISP